MSVYLNKDAPVGAIEAPSRFRRWGRWLLLVLAFGLIAATIVWLTKDAATGPQPSGLQANEQPATATSEESSVIPVQVITTAKDNTALTAYTIMSDGSWRKIGQWNRAANEMGGLVFTGTSTPGVYSLWRSTLGDEVLIGNEGTVLDGASYPLYAQRPLTAATTLVYSGDTYLTSGSSSNTWPTNDSTNKSLYEINSSLQVIKRWTFPDIDIASVEPLNLEGFSAEAGVVYATKGTYEGNPDEHIWRLDLNNNTSTRLTKTGGLPYEDSIVISGLDKALTVQATEVPCTDGCFNGTRYAAPYKVSLLNLKTNQIIELMTAPTSHPKIYVPTTGDFAYISLEKSVTLSGKTSLVSDGLWRVNVLTGEQEKLTVRGLIAGMSASGQYLLLLDEDSDLYAMSVFSGGAKIYDVERKTTTTLTAFPESKPTSADYLSCPVELAGSCLP